METDLAPYPAFQLSTKKEGRNELYKTLMQQHSTTLVRCDIMKYTVKFTSCSFKFLIGYCNTGLFSSRICAWKCKDKQQMSKCNSAVPKTAASIQQAKSRHLLVTTIIKSEILCKLIRTPWTSSITYNLYEDTFCSLVLGPVIDMKCDKHLRHLPKTKNGQFLKHHVLSIKFKQWIA